MDTISVILKNVYGNELIYPNCTRSKLFANIAGTKTLSRYTIEKIKAMGYTITITPSTL